jgi:TRAP-type C4-dicarboxylate transport system substrate-binding protein
MVDTLPLAPLWTMIGQFDRVTRYMLRVNWVPIVGATVMRRQTFDAMTPAAREALLAAARRAEAELRAQREVLDNEAIAAMEKRGLKVREMTPELEKEWRTLAERAYPHVRGTMVPADTFDRVRSVLDERRRGRS